MSNRYTQDPGDRQDYDFTIISSDGDTVSTCDSPIVSPAGLTSDGVDISGARAKLWLKDAAAVYGEFEVLLPIHTANGRVKVGRILVTVVRG